MKQPMNKRIIPPHGGYQSLLSYQRAEVVYDATVRFCADFLNKHARLAARGPWRKEQL